MTRDNNLLGNFELTGIHGAPKIEVTFSIDRNGILNVLAAEKGTGNEKMVTITKDKGRLSACEIEKMIKEAEQYKADDDKHYGRIKSKTNLENFAFEMKSVLEEAMYKCQEVIKWVDANDNAEKEHYDRQHKDLEEACKPIITKLSSFSQTRVPF